MSDDDFTAAAVCEGRREMDAVALCTDILAVRY